VRVGHHLYLFAIVFLLQRLKDVVQAIEQFFGIQFLNAEVYFISYLPSDLHTSDVLLVTGSAFVMSFIATLYPAYSASRTDPAEVLRYE